MKRRERLLLVLGASILGVVAVGFALRDEILDLVSPPVLVEAVAPAEPETETPVAQPVVPAVQPEAPVAEPRPEEPSKESPHVVETPAPTPELTPTPTPPPAPEVVPVPQPVPVVEPPAPSPTPPVVEAPLPQPALPPAPKPEPKPEPKPAPVEKPAPAPQPVPKPIEKKPSIVVPKPPSVEVYIPPPSETPNVLRPPQPMPIQPLQPPPPVQPLPPAQPAPVLPEIKPVVPAPNATSNPFSYFATEDVRSHNIGMFPRWTGMLSRFNAEAHTLDSICGPRSNTPCKLKEWRDFLEDIRNDSLYDKIVAVNKFLNKYPYVDDIVNWGINNYWETPYEFQRKSGNCKDYAIAKFMSLRALGVPNELMRVEVVKDMNLGGVIHAVLIVFDEDQAYTLDNQIKQVMPSVKIYHYVPIYSINEQYWWQHFTQ